MKKYVLAIFTAVFAFVAFCSLSYGACSWNGNTGTVASPYDHSDVQQCINDSSLKTGPIIISIPNTGGPVAWGGTASVNMSSGFSNVTSLTIQGSGTAPSVGSARQTVISKSYAPAFSITSTSSKTFRLTNVELRNSAQVAVNGTGRPGNNGGWRIDHIDFTSFSERAVWVEGRTYGVIDSSNIVSTYAVLVGIRENVSNDGGNRSWKRGPEFGTGEAVYLEGNYMEHISGAVHMCVDSDAGGRFVFRYNTTTNCYPGTHDVSSIGNARSAFSWEIYNNTMTTTLNYASGLIGTRGGTGYVYNNTLIGTSAYPFYGNVMHLTNYRSFGYASSSPWNIPCASGNSLKVCTGTVTSARSCSTDADCGGESGACQYADDPAGDGQDYPCRDQIGRTGDMELRPALFWNNKLSVGSEAYSYVNPGVASEGYVSQHIVLNRDYCQNNTTMPSSCNSIGTVYSAYSYPHPLTTGAAIKTPKKPENQQGTVNP